MTDTVIRVENLSKKYVIGHQTDGGYSTLRDKITDGTKAIGRLLTPSKKAECSTREEFWALKDVSFEVKQGDRLGIIGRNGAGKSTLLKILSRITEPTSGQITLQGRVASLLEVGTGFHPELTGRENIFLNGAILGMTKVEIQRKFDEIVDFAEIEKFLDTPVKRYSSGMYVRLAFAVAAHLEPEILIIDEILAVGDARFQEKCIGKMKEVSKNKGRTILFVSHNITTIQQLCSRGIMLDKGQISGIGNIPNLIDIYLEHNVYLAAPRKWIDLTQMNRSGTGEVRFTAIKYTSLNESINFYSYSDGKLEFLIKLEADKACEISSLAVSFSTQDRRILINADSLASETIILFSKGSNVVKLSIEELHLKPGRYKINLWLDKEGSSAETEAFDYIESAFEMDVMMANDDLVTRNLPGSVTCNFQYENVTI